MKTILKYVIAFVLAVTVASVLASLFSSQFVIAGLQQSGFEIPLSTRVSMSIKDFGILRLLLIAVGGCFLVGFLIAGFVAGKVPGGRSFWFTVAGATAIVTLLLTIELFLGGMFVGGARTVPGLGFQAIAGAVGGWLFAHMTNRVTGTKPKSRDRDMTNRVAGSGSAE